MRDSEADWLTLREARDHAARSIELAAAFSDALGPNPRIIDLGCGTGSNFRYLDAKLGGRAHWRCVDHDPVMLARAATLVGEERVQFEQRDLARELSELPVGPETGVTISAFLDITSAAWLDQLVTWCRERPLLAAMSFDGRLAWQPAANEDEAIRREWLAQRSCDEGFGPSLGPDAVGYLAQQLRQAGHRVSLAASDWQLGAGDRALLGMMVGGIARRVRATSPEGAIDGWVDLRNRQIEAGELRLMLGHVDLLSLPG